MYIFINTLCLRFIIIFPTNMSSSSIPDLIQYINGNIKLLSPYYENIKAKTRSKVSISQ